MKTAPPELLRLRSRYAEGPNWLWTWLAANHANLAFPTNTLDHQILPDYEDHVRFDLEEPLVLPQEEVRHLTESAYRLYEKGYLATRALYAYLGKQGTARVLRALYEEKAGGEPVTVEDLRRVARDLGGADISPLLDGFVLGDARADLEVVEVESKRDAGTYRTRIRVRRSGDLALPAVVSVRADGHQEQVAWDTAEAEKVIELDLESEPDEVVIDPEAWVPDTDRRNNFWPRAVRHNWFAPHPDTEAHVISFNPLPMHRRYLVGLSLSGREGKTLFWGTGTGMRGHYEAKASAEDSVHGFLDLTAYGELSLALARGSLLFLSMQGSQVLDDGKPSYQTGLAQLGHLWAIHEETELGLVGRAELPRTVVGAAVGLDAVRVVDPEALGWDYLPVEEGTGGHVALSVMRNEYLNLGFTTSMQLMGGLSPAEHDPFGLGVLDLDQELVLPWVGHLVLSLSGGALSRDASTNARPSMRLLPAWQGFEPAGPYDAFGSAGIQLRLPLLRERRIKNELGLGLIIFNDLSLDLHYGAAHGETWDEEGQLVLADPLGELGSQLRLGMAVFMGVTVDVAVGAAVPVWPAAAEWDQPRWYLRIDMAVLPIGSSEVYARSPGR